LQLTGMAIIIIGVCILTLPGGSLNRSEDLGEPKLNRRCRPSARPNPRHLLLPAQLARRALFGFIITFIAARTLVLLSSCRTGMPNLLFLFARHATSII